MAKAKSPLKVYRPKPNDKVGANLTAFGTADKPQCVYGFAVGPKGFFSVAEKLQSTSKTWGLLFQNLPKGNLDFYFFDISQPLVTLRRVKATGTGKNAKPKAKSGGLSITYPDNGETVPTEQFWAEGGTTTGNGLDMCRMRNMTDPTHEYNENAMLLGNYWNSFFDITTIQNKYEFRVEDTGTGEAETNDITVQSGLIVKKKSTSSKKKSTSSKKK